LSYTKDFGAIPLRSLSIAVPSTHGDIAEGPHVAQCLHVCAVFHEIWDLERFQTAKVTFKVI